jgi:hypothetical protein
VLLVNLAARELLVMMELLEPLALQDLQDQWEALALLDPWEAQELLVFLEILEPLVLVILVPLELWVVQVGLGPREERVARELQVAQALLVKWVLLEA